MFALEGNINDVALWVKVNVPELVKVTNFLIPVDSVPNDVIVIVAAFDTKTVPSSLVLKSVVAAAVNAVLREPSSVRSVACICWKLGAKPVPIVVDDVGELEPTVALQFRNDD